MLPVTVTPVSVPPDMEPVLPTLPIVPPLIVPELEVGVSSTAVMEPLSEPIDMPVIVPAPCAVFNPDMLPVTVAPVRVPRDMDPVLPTLPIVPPLIVPEL